MSVQTQIDRITQNISDTYSALSDMGATMPSEQNSDNLAATARTVPQGGGGGVQSDWNQTDDTAADFIKNKPFYETETVILEEQELIVDEAEGACFAELSAPIKKNDHISIVYNGNVYDFYVFLAEGVPYFGNPAILGGDEDTGIPFAGAYMDGMLILIPTDSPNPTVKISIVITTQIPTKYVKTNTMFYLRGDLQYLYLDEDRTIKATAKDVIKAMQQSNVLAALPEENIYMKAVSACPIKLLNVSYKGMDAIAVTLTYDLRTTIYAYTAEYTPET